MRKKWCRRAAAAVIAFWASWPGALRAEGPAKPSPLWTSPVLWAGGAIATAVLFDRSVQREMNVRQQGTLRKALGGSRYGRSGTTVEIMGEPYTTLGLSAVFYGAGRWLDDPRARRVGRAGALATATAGGAVLALKWAVGRNRPYAGHDADEVRPFQGGTTARTSFPSGHASVAFSMAAVVADEYDDWRVDGLAYGGAAAVAVSRIYQDRHWLSDVTAGACLGIGVGKWARRRAARKDGVVLATDGRRVLAAWKF